ncbi:hypothetical protein [Bifidobacterium avesanii]|uniref:Uncharacterized protein n=1 Tax=Bifidobacterium avesanii TaxID=1798157 RepID=A0A7K3TJN3_9BIFI|nr:hypothetical protein [Bifidobacterium avesanii]NEG79156.1 hypothetical protein [Bifidobacterium avesanii]
MSDRGIALPQGLKTVYEENATVVISEGMPMEIVREDIQDNATRIATAATSCLGLPLLSEEEMPTERDKQRLLDALNDYLTVDEEELLAAYDTAAIQHTEKRKLCIHAPSEWLLRRYITAWILCPERMTYFPTVQATIRQTVQMCPKFHLPDMETERYWTIASMLEGAVRWIWFAATFPDDRLRREFDLDVR